MEIGSYSIIEKVAEREQINILLASKIGEKDKRILKVFTPTTADKRVAARLRHEYEIQRFLAKEGIIEEPIWVSEAQLEGLSLPYYPGISLSEFISTHSIGIQDFLDLAISIASLIGKLHQVNVIHKDVNPQNILVVPESLKPSIIDYGLAGRLEIKQFHLGNPSKLEGTLGYISPEQTGRINRTVDHRSDLYSLGVSLYQLICQQLPFEEKDKLALVHSHIAKNPSSPTKLRPEIPESIAAIILKLLKKDPEDRYQSIDGLISDLMKCKAMLEEDGLIKIFPLGEADKLGQFLIPEKLYGRSESIRTLLLSYQQAAQAKTQLVHVLGSSGVGKSALVAEVKKELGGNNAFYIEGKFDQLNRNEPFSAWKQAFEELVKLLLTEDVRFLDLFRQKVEKQLGRLQGVLIEWCPGFKMILGEHPPLTELAPEASRQRLNLVINRFIKLMAIEEHPLVIFLDDLQWMDAASLGLLDSIMKENKQASLLLLIAYRNNELPKGNSFGAWLRKRENAEEDKGTYISLGNLLVEDIQHLVQDSFHLSSDESNSLASIVQSKTGGNAFFVRSLLQEWYEEKLISFDPDLKEWTWQEEKILQSSVSENIIDLMVDNLKKQSPIIQKLLPLAAIIGGKFGFQTLQLISKVKTDNLISGLKEAIIAGLIHPIHNAYEVEAVLLTKEEELDIEYVFVHDRIQQAAYSLVPASHRNALHTQLGSILLEQKGGISPGVKIFDIVNHLNYAQKDQLNDEKREQLIDLNIQAGEKAMANLAYPLANIYFQKAFELSGQHLWDSSYYSRSFKLHELLMECSYLLDDHEAMTFYFAQLKQNKKSVEHLARAYEIQVSSLAAAFKWLEAVETGVEFLHLLGASVPDDPSLEEVGKEYEQTDKALSTLSFEEIKAIPAAQDPKKIAYYNMSQNIEGSAYNVKPFLANVLSMQRMREVLQNGHSYVSPATFVSIATYYICAFNRLERGYALAEFGYELSEIYDLKTNKANFLFNWAAFVFHWKNAYRKEIPLLMQTYQECIETGKMDYVVYTLTIAQIYECLIPDDIPESLERITELNDTILEFNPDSSSHQDNLYAHQYLHNLAFPKENPHILDGEFCNQKEALERYEKASSHVYIATFHSFQASLAILFRDYQLAENHMEIATPFMPGAIGTCNYALGVYSKALAIAIMLKDKEGELRQKKEEELKETLAVLKSWADACPENQLQRYELVVAEYHRSMGQLDKAITSYDRAIIAAREHRDKLNHALAWERLASCYESMELESMHQIAIENAWTSYKNIRANNKLIQLERLYPFLKLSQSRSIKSLQTVSVSATSVDALNIDLASVMKASTAISEEIVLNKLLQKLTKLVVENAGAQRACFILRRKEEWFVETFYSLKQQVVKILDGIPLKGTDWVPESIINFVTRTRDMVVINDLEKELQFSKDPYFSNRKVESVLCSPIIHQAKLIGVLYLEHRETIGAFTEERVQILNVLAGQIAVSIENARTYEHLEELVDQRTEALTSALNELKLTQQQLVVSEKMASLGQLTAGIAHEINNPINFVLSGADSLELDFQDTMEILDAYRNTYGNTEDPAHAEIAKLERMLKPEELKEEIQGLINSIKKGAKRTAEIVQSLRTFARLEEDDYKSINVHENLDATLLLLQPEFGDKIKIESHYGELPPIQAYPGKLNQVFMNIISNAAQAMDMEGKIMITTEAKGNKVLVKIKDEGPGIPDDVLPQIFNPFFTTKTVGEGSGLGLSTAFSIVQMHKGQIKVETEVGNGSTFIIILPIYADMEGD